MNSFFYVLIKLCNVNAIRKAVVCKNCYRHLVSAVEVFLHFIPGNSRIGLFSSCNRLDQSGVVQPGDCGNKETTSYAFIVLKAALFTGLLADLFCVCHVLVKGQIVRQSAVAVGVVIHQFHMIGGTVVARNDAIIADTRLETLVSLVACATIHRKAKKKE